MPIHTRSLLFLIVPLLLAACGEDEPPPPDHRAIRAEALRSQTGPVRVVASWMWEKNLDLMRPGIEMAIEEVNEEGILGSRALEILWEDDNEQLRRGMEIAQRVVEDTGIAAVIGHSTSSISIPAATLYDSVGVLMLAPGATNPDLLKEGRDLVFRTIPSDEEAGRQLADLAGRQGFRRVGIFYREDSYGEGLAMHLKNRAVSLGMSIGEELAYRPQDDPVYQGVLRDWKESRLDAIFLAATMPHGAYLIRQAREVGMRLPILGSDGLDSPELLEIAGDRAEGVIVFSVFHPENPDPRVVQFVKRIRERTGETPDVWAALGYDTVHLYAEAVRRAGSIVPADVAATLRNMTWRGVTGAHRFDAKGELKDKKIIRKIVRNGKFDYLSDEMIRF